jgi:hypothetical protein
MKAGHREPKSVQYEPDGSGRDNFIIYNNGGLGVERLIHKIDAGGFYQGSPSIKSPPR